MEVNTGSGASSGSANSLGIGENPHPVGCEGSPSATRRSLTRALVMAELMLLGVQIDALDRWLFMAFGSTGPPM